MSLKGELEKANAGVGTQRFELISEQFGKSTSPGQGFPLFHGIEPCPGGFTLT
jgi:hypothetical protein